MVERLFFGVGALLFALTMVPAAVRGQTVYSDGQDHTVTGASGPISVQNSGTTVTVDSPAVVTGTGGVQGGDAIVGGVGTAINVLGGTVNGAGGIGVSSFGAFAAFGGDVSGVDAAVDVRAGSALVGGGTFRGGSVKDGSAGIGLISNSAFNFSSNVGIFGGTFYGGNSLHGVGGDGLLIKGDFDIGGGTFLGGSSGGGGSSGAHFIVGQSGLTESGSIEGGTFVAGTVPARSDTALSLTSTAAPRCQFQVGRSRAGSTLICGILRRR